MGEKPSLKAALPLGFAVLGALWPVFIWLTNLSGSVEAHGVELDAQSERFRVAEQEGLRVHKDIRDLLLSVDRRLSRIEGQLNRGRSTWERQ